MADEDLETYNGLPYDPDIDWNDPIKQYDEYGVCIFDPSLNIGTGETEDVESMSDPGMEETEIVIGVSATAEQERSGADGFDESDPLDGNQ